MTNTITTGSNLTDEQWLTNQYLNIFGRTPDLTSDGGGKYWLEQMAADADGHSRANVTNALQKSAEGVAYNDPNSATYGIVSPGGVDRSKSTVSQSNNEYLKSIANLGLNNADLLNTISANSFLAAGDGSGAQTTDNVAGGYFQLADNDIVGGGGNDTVVGGGGNDTVVGGGGNDTVVGGGGNDGTITVDGTTKNWWESFEDADAFKEFLQGGNKDDGMGDFMKFMMLMSVMGGNRGGMGGGGGSQYGYGGLNPGGVMQSYDPLAQLQGMGTWFKDNFGSGGATTSTVNTGTATGTT